MSENDLNIINKYKKEGDTIYEVSKKQKRNLITILLDFFLKIEPEKLGKSYLIATINEGVIVDISEMDTVNVHKIVEWTPELKKKFKKIEIDDYIYTKKGIIEQGENQIKN